MVILCVLITYFMLFFCCSLVLAKSEDEFYEMYFKEKDNKKS